MIVIIFDIKLKKSDEEKRKCSLHFTIFNRLNLHKQKPGGQNDLDSEFHFELNFKKTYLSEYKMISKVKCFHILFVMKSKKGKMSLRVS